jgi:hypothetical protein
MADIARGEGAAARPDYSAARGFNHAVARITADPRAFGILVACDTATGLALMAAFVGANTAGAGWWGAQLLALAVVVRHVASETAWQRFLLGTPRPGWLAYRLGGEEWRTGLALLGAGVLVMVVLALPAMLTIFILSVLSAGGFASWTPFILMLAGLLMLLPRLWTVVSLTVLRGRVAVFDDIAETARVWGSLILMAVLLSVLGLVVLAVLTTPLALGVGGYEAAGALLDSVDRTELYLPLSGAEIAAIVISSAWWALVWLMGRAACARAALDLEAAEAD